MPRRQSLKHSVTVAGHRTSITLEAAFWDSLREISETQNKSVNALIAEIDVAQPENLSSALRVYILDYYKNQVDAKK
jgi:predicted DNA-binding ribbon-helix-helix protein